MVPRSHGLSAPSIETYRFDGGPGPVDPERMCQILLILASVSVPYGSGIPAGEPTRNQ